MGIYIFGTSGTQRCDEAVQLWPSPAAFWPLSHSLWRWCCAHRICSGHTGVLCSVYIGLGFMESISCELSFFGGAIMCGGSAERPREWCAMYLCLVWARRRCARCLVPMAEHGSEGSTEHARWAAWSYRYAVVKLRWWHQQNMFRGRRNRIAAPVTIMGSYRNVMVCTSAWNTTFDKRTSCISPAITPKDSCPFTINTNHAGDLNSGVPHARILSYGLPPRLKAMISFLFSLLLRHSTSRPAATRWPR